MLLKRSGKAWRAKSFFPYTPECLELSEMGSAKQWGFMALWMKRSAQYAANRLQVMATGA